MKVSDWVKTLQQQSVYIDRDNETVVCSRKGYRMKRTLYRKRVGIPVSLQYCTWSFVGVALVIGCRVYLLRLYMLHADTRCAAAGLALCLCTYGTAT